MSTVEAEVKVSTGSEATRALEDRVMALEQDHRRLNKSYEFSTAVAAEREDFQENVRNEAYFMVVGLPAIKDLRGRDWMTKAMSDVQTMIRTLLGKELKIVVVHNATARSPGAEVRYSVQMELASSSQEIRSKFGSFFIGGQDRRPEALRSISISNRVTPGTQVRIMILKLLAKRYQSSNEGAKARVIGYEARPMIKLTPPETARDKRVKNFTYIEAIQKLPTNFTSSELRPIITKARVHFKGKLRSTFVVLDDDVQLPRDLPSAVVAEQLAGDGPDEVDDLPDSGEPAAPVVPASAARKRGRPSTDQQSSSESQRARR